MGGHALKMATTRRLPASDYHALATQVCQALTQRFGARAMPIPAYREKPDFGDLDILLEKERVLGPDGEWTALEEFARDHGHAREVVLNGPVMSYDHRQGPGEEVGFQVDLILAPARELDISLAYYSYNDLGNLIGRIAHKMGFTYGHRGLLLPVRNGTHQAAVLEVCQDQAQCLRFLGYDPDRFAQGFANRQEIYAYVVSTPYFNPDIFLLENRNHTSRMRDRKRPTYMGFLDYIRGLPADGPRFEFPEDKSCWLPQAFAAFPGLEQAHAQVQSAIAQSRRVHPFFNGQLVGQWTGLSDKRLGAFFQRARERLGGTPGAAALLDQGGPEAVREAVLALWREESAPRPRA